MKDNTLKSVAHEIYAKNDWQIPIVNKEISHGKLQTHLYSYGFKWKIKPIWWSTKSWSKYL